MRHKSSLLNMRSNYVKIPNRIFKIGLSPLSICIYCLLCSYSEDYNPTLSNISRTLGIHRNTVCKALKVLCDAKVITKIVQGRVFRHGSSQSVASTSYQSEYEFNNPANWIVTKNVKLTDNDTPNNSDTAKIIKE